MVSIPTIVSGTNAKGRVQNRRTLLPIDMLNIGRILQENTIPEQSRFARVKSPVLQQLQIRTTNGQAVLMEVSGETFTYDRDAEWLISSLATDI